LWSEKVHFFTPDYPIPISLREKYYNFLAGFGNTHLEKIHRKAARHQRRKEPKNNKKP